MIIIKMVQQIFFGKNNGSYQPQRSITPITPEAKNLSRLERKLNKTQNFLEIIALASTE